MKNLYQKKCKTCKKSFAGGPQAIYCRDCRAERQREQAAKYRRYGYMRALGSTDKCAVCGKDYIVMSGKQKYCKDCSKPAVQSADRTQGLAYYNKNKSVINSSRIRKRLMNQARICIICGKEFSHGGKPKKTCSAECRRENTNKWRREWDKARREKSKPGKGE